MKRTRIKHILQHGQPGEHVDVRGWVRTRRDSKDQFSFVELNDGSAMANLQIVVDSSVPGYAETIRQVTTGASVAVDAAPLTSGQALRWRRTMPMAAKPNPITAIEAGSGTFTLSSELSMAPTPVVAITICSVSEKAPLKLSVVSKDPPPPDVEPRKSVRRPELVGST